MAEAFDHPPSARSNVREAFPSIIPYSFVKSEGLRTKNGRIFPLGGTSERTTVFCNESGEFIIFESDEHGFNNPRELYKVGEVDIVLTGDSFAQGACVEPGKGIAGQLRKTWKGVLTVGSAHNGPLLELATLKEYAEPLHPRIVLWLYYEGNDLQNLLGAQTSPLLMKYLRAEFSQNLLDRQTEIDEILVDYVGRCRAGG